MTIYIIEKGDIKVMGNMNEEMAVIVVGYDGYSDLWTNFFELANKHWGDRNFPMYLANNTKQVNYENVSTINCGDEAEWSKKTRLAIESVNSKYICLMLEDFFIGSKVNNQEINNTLDIIKKENFKYYKLNNFSKVNTEIYKSYNYLHTIPENLEYGISLQPAIWERDFLLELLGKENYNAWIFEYDRIKESENRTNEALSGCVFDDRNIFEIQHGVVQGKFLPTVVKYFEKQNYHFDLTSRGVMSKKEYLYYKTKGKGKLLVKPNHRKVVKKYLGKLGMKFISDKVKQ